jgi:hypothetical protein
MLLKKFTDDCTLEQVYNTETKVFVSQTLDEGDQVHWYTTGSDVQEIDVPEEDPYLAPEMVQPVPLITAPVVHGVWHVTYPNSDQRVQALISNLVLRQYEFNFLVEGTNLLIHVPDDGSILLKGIMDIYHGVLR